MSKVTRIFEVEFKYRQVFDGKKDGEPITEKRMIVAKNATEAGGLVRLAVAKERTRFKDDDTGKMIECTSADYDPINITLEAEA